MNQAQGVDHIMQVVELDRAKSVAPTRKTEIANFEMHIKSITAAYLQSLDISLNTEAIVKEQFVSKIAKKDQLIEDLQSKVKQLQADKEAAETTAANALKEKERAEKDMATAEKVRNAAEKTAEDKQIIADTLAAKLAEAEKKAEGFDDLKAALSSSQDAQKAAEQRIKDIQRDNKEAAKDAAREAERVKEQAIKEITDTLRAQISDLQEKLWTSRSEADAAKHNAETARSAAIAELSQTHKAEMDEIRAKLDARTDELIQIKQQASDCQIQLQQAQTRIKELEAQLNKAGTN
jgi:DNA repair exonuclease SbcCD ATPase subunit